MVNQHIRLSEIIYNKSLNPYFNELESATSLNSDTYVWIEGLECAFLFEKQLPSTACFVAQLYDEKPSFSHLSRRDKFFIGRTLANEIDDDETPAFMLYEDYEVFIKSWWLIEDGKREHNFPPLIHNWISHLNPTSTHAC